MKVGIAGGIKLVGNINRINEYRKAGFSADQTREAFGAQRIYLKVVAGDFPLVANQGELCRKAMPKAVVRDDIAALSHVLAVGDGV